MIKNIAFYQTDATGAVVTADFYPLDPCDSLVGILTQGATALSADAMAAGLAAYLSAQSESPMASRARAAAVGAMSPTAGRYYYAADMDAEHTYSTYTHTRPQDATNAKWLLGWLLREALGFRKCDRCGKWISPTHRDDCSRYDGEHRYCNACVAAMPHFIEVYGYHDDTTGSGTAGAVRGDNGSTYAFVADGDETPAERSETIGFELEASNQSTDLQVRNGSRYGFYSTDAYWAIRSHFKHERDGSIGQGVEFISQVWTAKHFRDSQDVETLCECAKSIGADDADGRTGLHFHLAKTMFGADAFEQAKTVLKVIAFVTEYKDDFIRLSKREVSHMNYCKMVPMEVVNSVWSEVKAMEASGSNPFACYRSFGAPAAERRPLPNYMSNYFTFGNDHSLFVNCRGVGPTIEFRFLKSTTDPRLIRDYAEFLMGLVKSLRSVKFEKIYALGQATKAVPADTMARIRAMGCFLKTHAIITKGKAY
ncbi:MAG: hypothetical protein LKG11_00755 [Bacilli bacterium]|jgi:hypothetical protein|nr:hypothetical protein [Bacilli bacterium]